MARDSKRVRRERRVRRELSLARKVLAQLYMENQSYRKLIMDAAVADHLAKQQEGNGKAGSLSIKEVRDHGDAMESDVPATEGAVPDMQESIEQTG